MVDFDLKERIALINGGSRGIGLAIAKAYAQHGATVIITSRKAENVTAGVMAIEAEGGKAIGVPCHAGKTDQIDALFERIDQDFGRLDILVNCAATNPYYGLAIDISEGAYDKTFEVNCKGYFLMAQRAAKRMLAQGKGVILNIASTEGITPELMTGVYAITKATNIMLTKVLAKELGVKGIRCNCLCPGLTRTDLSKALTENPDLVAHYEKAIPLGRVGLPEEMAGAALYLVSDAASYTNGAVITCDGGIAP